jgi:mRNA interferase MazF
MKILVSGMLRGQVWIISLNPIKGSEQNGTRPAVIVSPDSMNTTLDTKVILPLTTQNKSWPSRVNIDFKGLKGQVMCEQIRTISATRLISYKGSLLDSEMAETMHTLKKLYCEE